MNCEHCKKTFSYKSSMLYHQKTAKYCLKIQGKESKLFKCEFCQNTLSTKQHYIEHIFVCKNKKDDDIKKKKNVKILDF